MGNVPHDALLQRQIALEADMAGLGVHRFTSRATKAASKGRGGDDQSGSYIVSQVINPMAAALREFINETYSGKPGRHPIAAKLIVNMDLDVVAYLGARCIMNGLMKAGSIPHLTLAIKIGKAVESEARFSLFKKEAPGLYRQIMVDLDKKGSTEDHRAKVMIYAMNKFDISWDIWSKDDKIQLGAKIIDLFVDAGHATAVHAHQSESQKAPRDQVRIELSAATSAWIEGSIRRGSTMWPEYMPMLMTPAQWSGLSGGGYITSLARPLPLVKGMRPGHRKVLEEADLGKVYAGLNAIQSTPWQVNRDVYEVMQQLHDVGSELAGLVSHRDIEQPARPHDIDTNAVALKEWKWAARNAHSANVHKRRDRVKQQTLLNLSKRFASEPVIYFPHNLDFRGRAYPVPQVLHPQGSDNVKALLRFAEGKPLDKEGTHWLAVHGANCFGIDKVPFEERVQWVEDNARAIFDCGADPLANLWWTEADSPWCFLAFCFEWLSYAQQGSDFLSHLPVALDGSCNGLQHFSAMLLDPIGGRAVNLLPAERPQDIYQVVADRVMEQLRQLQYGTVLDEQKKRWAHEWLHFGIDRKITKRPVMVLPYGGTPRSCLKYVDEAVMARITGGQGHNFGDELKAAIGWLGGLVWAAIGDVVVAASEAMTYLQKVARTTGKLNLPITWETPSGFRSYQQCLGVEYRLIKTKLAGSRLRLKLVDETDKINTAKQATSISPNFVHSMDAAAMTLTVARLAERGIKSFAMIHDSYATHACDTELLAQSIREVFVEMYQEDQLASFTAQQLANLAPGDAVGLPDLPKFGTLNIKEVLNSTYFFA